LTKFDLVRVRSNGKLDINEEQLPWILNVDKTEIVSDKSKTSAGCRPAVSFHDPQIPLMSRAVAKLSLVCTGIFGSARVPVTVPHTRECQEALAATLLHGKKFVVIGDEHVTLDGMFKVAIDRWIEEATEREKEKKNRAEYHASYEGALPILDCLKNDLESDAKQLRSKELEIPLKWKGTAVSKMGSVANRRVLFQQVAEGGAEEAIIPAPWIEINQAELDALRNAPIKLSSTVCVCFGLRFRISYC